MEKPLELKPNALPRDLGGRLQEKSYMNIINANLHYLQNGPFSERNTAQCYSFWELEYNFRDIIVIIRYEVFLQLGRDSRFSLLTSLFELG